VSKSADGLSVLAKCIQPKEVYSLAVVVQECIAKNMLPEAAQINILANSDMQNIRYRIAEKILMTGPVLNKMKNTNICFN